MGPLNNIFKRSLSLFGQMYPLNHLADCLPLLATAPVSIFGFVDDLFYLPYYNLISQLANLVCHNRKAATQFPPARAGLNTEVITGAQAIWGN